MIKRPDINYVVTLDSSWEEELRGKSFLAEYDCTSIDFTIDPKDLPYPIFLFYGDGTFYYYI